MKIPAEWLALAPKPPALASGKRWHVFLSYRSVHRRWVLQLHDTLASLGFKVFLDQFVLKSSDDLVLALSAGLEERLSGCHRDLELRNPSHTVGSIRWN
jgi:hypothetical protein